MKADEAKMRAANCDGDVSKPIEVKTFAAHLRAMLSKSSAPVAIIRR